jgi:hypothetical protein
MRKLIDEFGIDNIGFLTLTFGDDVKDHREASRRLNSLRTNVLKGRYCRGIAVRERHKSGRLHFHLVVVVGKDIRTGIDFEAIGKRDYRSASPALRAEWKFWREIAPRYGFGRTELLPVKSSKDGVAKYLGTYIGKDFENRVDRDKGARFYSFWGYKPGDRSFRPGFMTAGEYEWLWRKKVKYFALSKGITETMVLTVPIGQSFEWNRQKPAMEKDPIVEWKERRPLFKTLHGGMEVLTHFFGSGWAYRFREEILDTSLPADIVYPSFHLALQESELRLNKLHLTDRNHSQSPF